MSKSVVLCVGPGWFRANKGNKERETERFRSEAKCEKWLTEGGDGTRLICTKELKWNKLTCRFTPAPEKGMEDRRNDGIIGVSRLI